RVVELAGHNYVLPAVAMVPRLQAICVQPLLLSQRIQLESSELAALPVDAQTDGEHNGSGDGTADQPFSPYRPLLFREPAQQRLAQSGGHRHGTHHPDDPVVDLPLDLGQRAALGTIGQMALQRIGFAGLQLAAARAGEFQKLSRGSTVHQTSSALRCLEPSFTGLSSARLRLKVPDTFFNASSGRFQTPGPAAPNGCADTPWPVPAATSPF